MATKRLLPRSLTNLTKPICKRQSLTHPSSRTSSTPTSKAYHSQTHPPPPLPFTSTESAILTSATPHIPTHGFTNTTLALGARDAEYIDASVNLFPKGAFSLVHWHLVQRRLGLKGILEEVREREGGRKLGVGECVKMLVWERLLGNREIVHRWQEAQSLILIPSNLPTSLHELHALSDEIWYLAGDISVDTSWYSKRATVSAIYASAELYMTTDKSAGFEDTKAFLERRFEDSRLLGQVVGDVGEWIGFVGRAGVNVLRSRGVRI